MEPKPFKSVDDQIAILQDRGMEIWGYRTLRVAGGVTFRLSGAGKSVF